MNGQRNPMTHGRRCHRVKARRHTLLTAFFAAVALTPAQATNPRLVAGLYALESYTVMPHLDEMRRITKTEQRCIGNGDVTGLFPVMRQTAFRGCALLPRASDEGEYELSCQTELVATGRAVLYDEAGGLSGTLAVKMGGKNMTFSQHTTARFVGACAATVND